MSYYLGLRHGYVFVLGSHARELQCFPLKISAEIGETLGVDAEELNRPLAAAVVNRWLAILSKPAGTSQNRALGTKVVSRKAIFTGPQAVAFGEIILPPAIRRQISDSGASVITIVPDGALAELPFEALPVDQDQFVLDVLPALDYAPSAMILASLQARERERPLQSPQIVTLGDPQYSQTKVADAGGVRRWVIPNGNIN